MPQMHAINIYRQTERKRSKNIMYLIAVNSFCDVVSSVF